MELMGIYVMFLTFVTGKQRSIFTRAFVMKTSVLQVLFF